MNVDGVHGYDRAIDVQDVFTKRDEGELEWLSTRDASVACRSQESAGSGASIAHREKILSKHKALIYT